MPVAPLDAIPPGTDVFIDANIFVYGLQEHSAQCGGLLRRCATEVVYGVTTLEVIAEATHRLMLAEAVREGIIKKESASSLRQRPAAITKLTTYWTKAESILGMNIMVLPTDEARHRRAHLVRSAEGLLTNDSLIVAAMREYGLGRLASADKGFDHIQGLTRYSPTDLPEAVQPQP
jgi:predicted nucleic acid-binding protein